MIQLLTMSSLDPFVKPTYAEDEPIEDVAMAEVGDKVTNDHIVSYVHGKATL